MGVVKAISLAVGISLATSTITASLKKWWGLSRRGRRSWASAIALMILGGCIVAIAKDEMRSSQLAGQTSIGLALFVHSSGHAVTTELSASKGDSLTYIAKVWNVGPGEADKVQIAVGLAPYETYVCGSARLRDSLTGASGLALDRGDTNGACLGNHILNGGLTIDSLNPDAVEYVGWSIRVGSVPQGKNRLRTAVSARSSGKTDQIYSVAFVDVNA